MELIIQNDGLYQLVPLTKEMTEHILLLVKVNCMDLCEILKINLTSYVDSLNLYVMNDGSGNFYGCICKED